MKLFVTGTDTGVGKTFVAAMLARTAVERGLKVLAWKPIETGVTGEFGDDQNTLFEAAGSWQSEELRGLYRFKAVAAPLVAARAEGKHIDIPTIAERLPADIAQVVVVEGAGGWRVPVTENDDMAALARRLRLPVLVVARAGLGSINHTLLTIEAIRKDKCALKGVVLSVKPTDDAELCASNAAEIARVGNVPVHVLGTPADLWTFCST